VLPGDVLNYRGASGGAVQAAKVAPFARAAQVPETKLLSEKARGRLARRRLFPIDQGGAWIFH
jgi:hypothetical protein